MRQIDDYLDQLYKGLNSSEAQESKQEMKMHLLEAVNELIKEGKNEHVAVEIALTRFGEKKHLNGGLYSLFSGQKKSASNLFKIGFTAFGLASILAAFLIILDTNNFRNIDENIPFAMIFNLTNTLFILSGIILLTSFTMHTTHRIKFNRYKFN